MDGEPFDARDLSPDAFHAQLGAKPLRLSGRWREEDDPSTFAVLANRDWLLRLLSLACSCDFVGTNPKSPRSSLPGPSVSKQFEIGPKSPREVGVRVVPVDLNETSVRVMCRRGRMGQH